LNYNWPQSSIGEEVCLLCSDGSAVSFRFCCCVQISSAPWRRGLAGLGRMVPGSTLAALVCAFTSCGPVWTGFQLQSVYQNILSTWLFSDGSWHLDWSHRGAVSRHHVKSHAFGGDFLCRVDKRSLLFHCHHLLVKKNLTFDIQFNQE
jgi:hypothetical protein